MWIRLPRCWRRPIRRPPPPGRRRPSRRPSARRPRTPPTTGGDTAPGNPNRKKAPRRRRRRFGGRTSARIDSNFFALDVALNAIEPFHRFVGEDAVPGLRYPLKDNTVPVWAVPVVAVAVPVAIVAGIYVRRRNVYDLHHAILGLLFSVLITAVLTDAIKDGVGRPRPDFFWRCFPDGLPKYNNVTREVICHGDPAVIKEGYKSFPSGHTSWSFAGLAFLSWYLAGKIKAFDRGGHVAKLCIVAAPLLLASMVAVSRVDDYWHHWQDVFTAGVLGLVVASFCYLQFFPPPSGEQGFWPHSYFEHMLTLDGEIAVQSAGGSSRLSSLTLDSSPGRAGMDMRTSSQAFDAMESGRRS